MLFLRGVWPARVHIGLSAPSHPLAHAMLNVGGVFFHGAGGEGGEGEAGQGGEREGAQIAGAPISSKYGLIQGLFGLLSSPPSPHVFLLLLCFCSGKARGFGQAAAMYF